ncbi:hypothetical protein ACXRSW_05360 [Aeromonas dhakensis]|nr:MULTISPECIES: hypothetical protein [Aeromonas]GKQ62477.1 hypothetical protein KAM338_26540 [Aeromonas caviae]ELM3750059.1 hypothetical protein [Aeromonas dhakensis]MBL0460467.1 hypothetical protein [Aeromonas dhakensis]MBL0602386.1 hypothetical protein [Aeromonas dhakensis]MBL0620190.1 hypothetical protein [Aeromonas dhakensis]
MSYNRFPELMTVGRELLTLLENGEVNAAELLIDRYLEMFNDFFQNAKLELVIDIEQQQALLEFQSIYKQVENTKNQTEAALLKISKAGRASDLYKLNLG